MRRSLGEPEEGLEAVAEARRVIEATGTRGFEAHVDRVEGELHRANRDPDAAVDCLQRAMATARRQQARLSELRAAVSLADLWRERGRRNEAYDLVAPLYGWFSEGTAERRPARRRRTPRSARARRPARPDLRYGDIRPYRRPGLAPDRAPGPLALVVCARFADAVGPSAGRNVSPRGLPLVR